VPGRSLAPRALSSRVEMRFADLKRILRLSWLRLRAHDVRVENFDSRRQGIGTLTPVFTRFMAT
jgi:hypothetical protein